MEYAEGSVIIIVCNWLNVFSRANNKNVDIILSASAESTGLLTQAGVGGATEGGAVRVCVITSVARRRSHALAYHYTEYFPSPPTLVTDSPSPQLMQQLDPNL